MLKVKPSKPILSVIIVVGDQRLHFADCLRSVLHQNIIRQMEVLVIDCSNPEMPRLEGIDHPSIRHIYLSNQVTFGEARAQGLREANSEVVAYLEEHCIALPGWAEALVDAHAGPWAGVGGEIYNGNSGVGISDAIYLLGYSRWFPPALRGETVLLPGHNTSYKREQLLNYEGELSQLLIAEPILQWKLYRDGRKLFLEPRAKIMHLCETRFDSLGAYFWWNRCFGGIRVAAFQWPRWKRALYAAMLPLRPWVQVFKLAAKIIRDRPQGLWTFMWNIPLIVLIEHLASLGIVLGTVLGTGKAEARFTTLELSHGRNHRSEIG
jgi:glycosyltransferase involved in cell wall biosynthesis